MGKTTEYSLFGSTEVFNKFYEQGYRLVLVLKFSKSLKKELK